MHVKFEKFDQFKWYLLSYKYPIIVNCFVLKTIVFHFDI
jgi:hypothetical protein